MIVGMSRWLVLPVLAGCTSVELDVRVQRQSASLASIDEGAWRDGSIVQVGLPGSFTFPQPLALRLSLADRSADGEMPVPLAVNRAMIAAYGDAAFEIIAGPTCGAVSCDAELLLSGSGTSMFSVTLTGPDGVASDCAYVAMFEDPDPTTVSESLRADVETHQTTCVTSLR